MNEKKQSELGRIRSEIDDVNGRLLELLNERARLVQQIGPVKQAAGHRLYDPVREAEQLQRLMLLNRGPMSNAMVERIFRAVFQAFLSQQMEAVESGAPLVMEHTGTTRGVAVGGLAIGGGKPVVIAGPCAIEDEESLDAVAAALSAHGVRFLRGGAFKPRKSPYTFQGLGMQGVEMLARVAKAHGMLTVSEITDGSLADAFADHVDLIQVGAHNMFNYDLLKKLARIPRPVLLKRHFAARMEELILAAEYLYSGGNRDVIFCERGIRTFETSTRNTLDISAVGLVKETTDLPILVDVSHAAGRRDLLLRLSKAALAAGADGIMVEVHRQPDVALSDGSQQLDLEQFKRFMDDLQPFLE